MKEVNSLKSALTNSVFALLWALVLSPSAQAADPLVVPAVTATPGQVTYYREANAVTGVTELKTYVAYEITVANNSTNVINNVRIEGTTTVVGAAQTAPFVTSVTALGTAASCDPITTDRRSITCAIGQIRGSSSSASFVVVFKAPTAGTKVEFAWTLYYGEGSNDNGAHNDTATGTAVTTLGTTIATEVSSYALPNSTFFTGASSTASPGDNFTTKVTVPDYAKALIKESTFTTNCNNFLTCWQSDLTIPGTFSPYLMIVLSQDASNIKPGTKIGSVVIRYEYHDINNVLQEHIVGPCSNSTTPRTDGLPCIADSVQYKRNTPGWTLALDGDMVWWLISTNNGRFGIQ